MAGTTLANIGYLQFYLGTTASPTVYNSVEEVVSVSNLGFDSSSIDVTNFDSLAGYKEFIAALKEGVDVTVVCNHRLSSNTQQLAFITAAKAGVKRNFRLTYIGASPLLHIKFEAAPTGLKYLPSVTDRNQLEFTLKISGALS